jgi:hypothetical protein
MPSRYDPDQVERLIAAVDSNTETMQRLEIEVLGTSQVAEDAKGTADDAKLIVLVSAGCLLLVLLAVTMGIWYSIDAKHTVDNANQERAERSVTACVYSNAQLKKVRDTLVLSLASVIPENQALTREQQESLDRYKATVEATLTYRNCTDEGIKAYFENPPKDPARGGN